jgi:multidrug efflux pump subunit AcrB
MAHLFSLLVARHLLPWIMAWKMQKETVTDCILRGVIMDFKSIFKIYSYSQKATSEATGISTKRLRAIIDHPALARPSERLLLSQHFNISHYRLKKLMSGAHRDVQS